jgi:hypothetical protein
MISGLVALLRNQLCECVPVQSKGCLNMSEVFLRDVRMFGYDVSYVSTASSSVP